MTPDSYKPLPRLPFYYRAIRYRAGFAVGRAIAAPLAWLSKPAACATSPLRAGVRDGAISRVEASRHDA